MADRADEPDLFAFGEKLLTLLDEGSVSTTYKYAVLLALIDLCLENSGISGAAPDVVTTWQLAERVVEIYWPQTASFPGTELVLGQSKSGRAEILSLIVRFRARHAPDPSAPLSHARLAAPAAFERLVRSVEWKLVEMPLPRVQVVGQMDDRFLYEIGWDDTVRRGEFESSSFDNRVLLKPRRGDQLVRLAALLRPLVQRKWSSLVGRLNRQVVQDALLDEFLFGSRRIALARVRDPLRDLQNNRCFYCDERLGREIAVDHFLPWARHPDDGIENLVVADARCNGDKRDFLAAAHHLARWRRERFGAGVDLGKVAERVGWDRHPSRTLGTARSIYLKLPEGVKLWSRRRIFVDAERAALIAALGNDRE